MQVFFPIRSLVIEASAPHPPNTQYLVTYGREHWGEDMQLVYKVQMVYDGKVSGRKSPSFPDGTDDFENVQKAMRRVARGEGQPGRGLILSTAGENFVRRKK